MVARSACRRKTTIDNNRRVYHYIRLFLATCHTKYNVDDIDINAQRAWIADLGARSPLLEDDKVKRIYNLVGPPKT